MNARTPGETYLAFDGGGTSTRAAWYDAEGSVIASVRGGPSNPVSFGLTACLATLTHLGRGLLAGQDAASCTVAAGVSGARNQRLRDAIASGLLRSLGVRRVLVASDVDALVHANVGAEAGVVVIAGTGSSVVAKKAGGEPQLFGGRGELFGDAGSAYQIAVSALRAAADAVDGLGEPTHLVEVLPQAAGVAAFGEMVGWSRAASKHEIAGLAPCVTELAQAGDRAANRCIHEQIVQLVKLTAAAAKTTGILSDGVPVYLNGALFESSSMYAQTYTRAMDAETGHLLWNVQLAPKRGADASLQLALCDALPAFVSTASKEDETGTADITPTETARLGAMPLDRLTASEIVTRMNRADQEAVDAVRAAQPAIVSVVECVARCFREGGRLIYMGAGTSGRLGVLDASECPPTFGVDPEQVVGVIAGGEEALRRSGEGAEDDEAAAVADLQALHPPLSATDVVVGIAASGTTPYVIAGLVAAQDLGAHTVLVCCNPLVQEGAQHIIVLDTGPEVLPGSTRLKAGTATKLVLNMISTGAMALSGRVFDGHMVGVRPMNAKLRRRAERIVAALTGLAEEDAAGLLADAGDRIAVAVLMARLGLDRQHAEARLASKKGNLREALGLD